MSRVIGTLALAALTAIPVIAILSVYREDLQPYAAKAGRLLAFDPRYAPFGFSRR